MELSIEQYLRESRQLLKMGETAYEFNKVILSSLNSFVKEYDEKINIVGIFTPEYRNTIVTLDVPYIVLDFSIMDLFVELSYIYNNNDWGRYKYLYYTLSQQPEYEAGDIDKVFFYEALAARYFNDEKNRVVEESKNISHMVLSFYFIALHELFHHYEKRFSANDYHKRLREYIETIEYGGTFCTNTNDQIMSEVICDTRSIIYLMDQKIGYQKILVNNKDELFEICLDTLVQLTIIRVLLRKINNINDITKRVQATFGWIATYWSDYQAFKDIDYLPIIERAKNKIKLFMQKTTEIAKTDEDEDALIPNFSAEEKIELLTSLQNIKDGTIMRL